MAAIFDASIFDPSIFETGAGGGGFTGAQLLASWDDEDMSALAIKLSEATAARRRVPFTLRSATDGSAITGATGTARLSKVGGATPTTTAASTNSVVELDATNMPGRYYLELTATEVDTLGEIEVYFKAAASYVAVGRAQVVAYDPYDATALGLSRVDAAVTSRMATFTLPANFAALSISAAGLVDLLQTAADKVWGTTTRRLSDGTNIVLAKGTGVTGFNDITAAAVFAVLLTAITSGDGSVGGLLKQMLDAATSTRASAAALATVQADTDDLQTRLPAALVGGALPAHLVSTATDVITSATLDATAGAELAAALLDLTNGVESSLTVREALRILFAFAAGNADGLNAASGTAHFKDSSGTKNRITSAKDGTSRTNTLDKT